MENTMEKNKKLVLIGAASALSLAGIVAFAGVAVASTSATSNSEAVTSGGGAFDLNGNPVESKTYIGDVPPADLGELQFSGEASVSDSPQTGSFGN